MISKRLIPKLLLTRGDAALGGNPVLVTTKGFSQRVEIGNPLSQAKIYQAQSADELVLLLIDSISDGVQFLGDVCGFLANELFMPFTVGGSIRSIKDVEYLFSRGADKVSINHMAIYEPQKVAQIAKRFGRQNLLLSVDFKRSQSGGFAEIYSDGGKHNTHINVIEHCKAMEQAGVGEILLSSISHDGYGQGMDCEIACQVAEAVSVPVLLSGGCGVASHFIDGFRDGRVDGVCAGTFFASKDQNPIQARAQIKNAGFLVRSH